MVISFQGGGSGLTQVPREDGAGKFFVVRSRMRDGTRGARTLCCDGGIARMVVSV